MKIAVSASFRLRNFSMFHELQAVVSRLDGVNKQIGESTVLADILTLYLSH